MRAHKKNTKNVMYKPLALIEDKNKASLMRFRARDEINSAKYILSSIILSSPFEKYFCMSGKCTFNNVKIYVF